MKNIDNIDRWEAWTCIQNHESWIKGLKQYIFYETANMRIEYIKYIACFCPFSQTNSIPTYFIL